ncbi:unnamed protein product [Paramecium primaurelia]|uniref:Tubulin-tyrosine ligase family protein n=1 Tax=Paramecium primaurelia TaxID=5886 RepID=A0A8S1K1U7_PARPR|nr:unnamed protein product [Paramecium primaurelia]
MQQNILSQKKIKYVENIKNHHYYACIPQKGNPNCSDKEKINLQNESSLSQKTISNNSYSHQSNGTYYKKHSIIFRELRSISNQSHNDQIDDIPKAFIFRIKSKNHIQNEPLIIENQEQKEKDRKTKDLAKVLRDMKKKRQEYTQKGQFVPKSPIPLLKHKNNKIQEDLSTEKSPNQVKKLPKIYTKQAPVIIEVLEQYEPLSKSSRLQGNGIGEDPFQVKLTRYYQFLFKFQCNHLFYVKQSQVRSQSYYIEVIDENEIIIKELMRKRWWWCEQIEKTDDVYFFWSKRSNSQFLQKQKIRVLFDESQNKVVDPYNLDNYEEQIKFAIEHKLALISPSGRLHNHIEINQLIGFKKNFIKFLEQYASLLNLDLFQYFPYSINISSQQDPKLNIFLTQQKNQNSLWIVKPGEWANNGLFMKICQNVKQVYDFIISEFKNQDHNFETLVIQKYIKPLLYYKRKFDLYTYLLISQINGVVRVYFYDEVYGRTSSKEYNEQDLDPLIHFTNSPIQKESKGFSLQEPGNKLSIDKLQEFFVQFKLNFKETMIPQLKAIAIHAIKAVFTHLVVKDHNFEIIGLNYIVDQDFKPWLVELNLNPSFIPDCQYHQKVITQMLDNALYLTIDLIYPPPSLWPSNKKQLIDRFNLQNKFQALIDSRFDSEMLIELFEKK